jgi:hypothetical protein
MHHDGTMSASLGKQSHLTIPGYSSTTCPAACPVLSEPARGSSDPCASRGHGYTHVGGTGTATITQREDRCILDGVPAASPIRRHSRLMPHQSRPRSSSRPNPSNNRRRRVPPRNCLKRKGLKPHAGTRSAACTPRLAFGTNAGGIARRWARLIGTTNLPQRRLERDGMCPAPLVAMVAVGGTLGATPQVSNQEHPLQRSSIRCAATCPLRRIGNMLLHALRSSYRAERQSFLAE